MKTRYADKMIHVTLSKPETILLSKAHELTLGISKMQPIDGRVQAAADSVATACEKLLALIGDKEPSKT